MAARTGSPIGVRSSSAFGSSPSPRFRRLPRAAIVRRALQMAQARLPGLRAAEVLVIGDTPHDVDGAHAIGIPVLAVASNTHTLEELSAHKPWRVMAALPSPQEFAALVGASF